MIEKAIERLLFACRWLLAPLYLGLALALIALGIKFFQEAFHVVLTIGTLAEDQLVLIVLTLIDIAGESEKLGWLGKLDAGTLKLKVAASIVAISSIHLLKVFMDVKTIPNDKILWYVVLHLTFVVSALLLGVLDRMSFADKRP